MGIWMPRALRPVRRPADAAKLLDSPVLDLADITDAIRSGSDSPIIAETPCPEPSRLYAYLPQLYASDSCLLAHQ
jgi:hypothetical protein